jgi:hypothetical protein
VAAAGVPVPNGTLHEPAHAAASANSSDNVVSWRQGAMTSVRDVDGGTLLA